MEVQEDIESTRDYQVPTHIPFGCFRTYDIRGPVDADNITPDLTYAIGLAIGSEAQARGERHLIVARDGRLSGPILIDALLAGLQASGIDVVFIGVVPTPVLYFATNWLPMRSGVMLTASHNPKNHNGFKIVLKGQTLKQQEIQAIRQRIETRDFITGRGDWRFQDVVPDYIDYLKRHIVLEKPLKLVVDCGNGVGGEIAPQVYRALGCEVIELYCELDGNFPNHHPDPTIPANLVDLIERVKAHQADIGLALDGDADRLGVVTNQGEIIWPDRQMMLFSTEVLARHPGAEIIFDVKCSSLLPKIIKQHGGKPVMWCTGHSLIKGKLFELNAPFAGELSGHLFFNDQWFGFDDGIYVGARLLRILANDTRTAHEIFAALPNHLNTPELKLAMPESEKPKFMQRFIEEGKFEDAEKITLDGIRLEYKEGWALVRPSNTSPFIILRFEADSKAALQRIQALVAREILKINPSLILPF